MPAAVLQTEFLSKGCHEPTLPMKDAGAGELLSQRDVGKLDDMVDLSLQSFRTQGLSTSKGLIQVCLVQVDRTSYASLSSSRSVAKVVVPIFT